MISAVILTKNEEENISKCLKSVHWCDEIVVVDDYSEDGTVERIRNHESGIRNNNKYKIFKRRLNNDFAKQRNFGLEKARGEWVVFVDADEVVPDNLGKEIIKKIQRDDTYGYYIRRKDFFMGRWLMYGETANIRLLRLAKKDSGRWEGRVHEIWQVKGTTGILNNPLEHYPHPTISSFLKKINIYTNIVAQYWMEQGRKISSWEIVVNPLGKFLHNFLFKFGFLDGVPGFIMAVFMSFHSFLARGKYWLMINRK